MRDQPPSWRGSHHDQECVTVCLLSAFTFLSPLPDRTCRWKETFRNKYKNREYWFQTDRPSTLRWCKGWKNVSKFSSYRFLLIWNHENCWAAMEFRDPILWSTFPIRERILAGWKVFSSGTKTITILSKIIEGVLTMKTLAWRPDCWDDFISINFSPMIG